MTGHVRKRGKLWEVVLELGEQPAQRCPLCMAVRGRRRGRLLWIDKGRHEVCPTCGGELEDVTARRQAFLPERYRTKTEARDALTRELAAALNGVFVDPERITLGEYLTDHWLPSLEDCVRPSTLIAYRGHVTRYLVPLLGDVPLRKLTPTAVNGFHKTLRETPRRPRRTSRPPVAVQEAREAPAPTEAAQRPLSERTRRHVHVTLTIALNAAVRQGLLATNPAARATAPPKRGGGELHTWTSAELSAFLGSTREDRLAPLWRFLAMTGARRGEALGLKWSDVDFAGGRVTIQRARVQAGGQVYEAPPKTRASRRAIPLDAATLAALRALKAQQAAERLAWGPAWQAGGWVFTREDGVPLHPGSVTKAFYEAQARTELPRIRLHDLRHTSATLALAGGLHPKVVQERLGHATISQTLDTYSHTTPTLHEEAAARLAAMVDGEG